MGKTGRSGPQGSGPRASLPFLPLGTRDGSAESVLGEMPAWHLALLGKGIPGDPGAWMPGAVRQLCELSLGSGLWWGHLPRSGARAADGLAGTCLWHPLEQRQKSSAVPSLLRQEP